MTENNKVEYGARDDPANVNPLFDYSSAFEFHKSGDIAAKELAVAHASVKLLQKELKECIMTEGVNAREHCMDLRLKYLEVMKDKFNGMRFPGNVQIQSRTKGHLRIPGDS